MQDKTPRNADEDLRPGGAPAEPAAPPPDADPGPEAPEPVLDPNTATVTASPAPPEPRDPVAEAAAAEPPREPPVAAPPPAEPEPNAADRGAAAPDQEDSEDDEPQGRSLAARALIALVLIIAGAALALWAAPRIAPHLPAGMAPVAAWLTPGGDATEARVAALEAGMRAELDALRAEMAAQTPDLAPIEARLAELEASLEARLAAMAEEMGALEGAAGGERLARLEAGFEGQEAAIASLRQQIEAGAAEGVAAEVDVYEAELAGLRGELRDISGQVGALAGRLEEVAADAQRQVEIARTQVEAIETEAAAALGTAEREATLTEIRSALEAGAPYAEATGRLAADGAVAVPQNLAAAAEAGVPTLARLRDSFPDAAHAAIRADIMARAGEGTLARARAFAEAQVASRSLTPRPGADADAVLSRMEAALAQGDLATALAEAEALPPAAAEAMASWLGAARARAAALADLQRLEADLTATN